MAFPYKKFSDIREMGTGGIEDVFFATVQSTSHRVVIKKLASDLGEYHGNYKKFDHNAKTLQSLHHDNIIRVFDYGVYENSYYLSMEYIDGFDLEKLLKSPSFDRNIGLMIVFEALKGLMHAHKHGVFHCDIKPGNILVSKNGSVKLSDFGLAHVKEHLLHAAGSGSVFITPFYMPPEQASAIAEQALDSDVWAETTTLAYKETMKDHEKTMRDQTLQWDMWSVGVLLYRVCTGVLPFNGENLAQLANSIATFQIRKPHYLVPSIPADLSDLIESCLIKDPAKRLSSLDPVIASLQLYFLAIGAHELDAEIRNHLLNYAQPSVKKTVQVLPEKTIAESSVFPRPAVSSPLLQPKIIKTAGIAIAVLIVLILSVVFFMHRSDKRSSADVASSQNNSVSAPSTHSNAPAETISSETPPVPAPPAEGFLEIDSAITDIASSGIPQRGDNKIKPKKKALVKPVVPSSPPPASASVDLPEKKPSKIKSNGKKSKVTEGIIKVTVEPFSAVVAIDGEKITSQEIAMGRQFPAGQHDISVTAEGYASYRSTLQVEPGATQIMSIVLKQRERGSGFLNVYSYPWSTIFIDGTMLGTTPTPSPVALAEGEHTMRLERDGFMPYKEIVTIRNGEVTRVQVDLVKQDAPEPEFPEPESNGSSPAEPDTIGQK